MNERDRLIEIFRGRALYPIDCASIADFIIADRKRICEPLVKAMDDDKYRISSVLLGYKLIKKAVNETLKLAGITDE